jgi:ClpP class serine protease
MYKITRNKAALALVLFSLIMIVSMVGIYFWEPGSGGAIGKKGIIGVIQIQGAIEDPNYANTLSAAVHEASIDNNVKAVILEINSPGGSAYLVEQIYMDLLELKSNKPVICSASQALSGGYYLAVSAQEIFALPSAMIGNVGVIGVGPGFIVPSENTYETGPQKLTGFSPALFPFNLSKALDSFASAVQNGRGSRLNIAMSDLKRGSVFMGSEALKFGLVDDLGSDQRAIDYAAKTAGLESYTMEDLVAKVSNSTASVNLRYPNMNDINEMNPPPSMHYLYMPNEIYMQSGGENPVITIDQQGNNETKGPTKLGQVVVDVSHGNRVSPWVLDSLTAELAKRGIYVGYSSNWTEVKSALDYAQCLIIIAPTQYYSYEEYQTIKNFTDSGKLLIFFSDASSEFLSTSTLQGPINSLSDHWGLHFGKGYLYTMDNYYGFYRDVPIIQFENNFLTKDLNKVVFFTSTYISPTDCDAAYAIWGTEDSVTEKVDLYPMISVLQKGNNTVVAFGDITWMMEPWIETADNYQLAMNLVNKIVEFAQK